MDTPPDDDVIYGRDEARDLARAERRYLDDEIGTFDYETLVAYVLGGGTLTPDGHMPDEHYKRVVSAVERAGGIVV